MGEVVGADVGFGADRAQPAVDVGDAAGGVEEAFVDRRRPGQDVEAIGANSGVAVMLVPLPASVTVAKPPASGTKVLESKAELARTTLLTPPAPTPLAPTSKDVPEAITDRPSADPTVPAKKA